MHPNQDFNRNGRFDMGDANYDSYPEKKLKGKASQLQCIWELIIVPS